MSRHAGIVLAGGFVVAPGPCLLWIVRMLMLFVVLKNGGGAEIVSLRESQSQVIRENRGIILWGWGKFPHLPVGFTPGGSASFFGHSHVNLSDQVK